MKLSVAKIIQCLLVITLAVSMTVVALTSAYATSTFASSLKPSIGEPQFAPVRFISPDTMDPTAPGVGTNRYAYSENDPVNKSDPNGHVWGWVVGGIIGYFASTTEANTPTTPDDTTQTSEMEALVNTALGAASAPTGGVALGIGQGMARASTSKGLSYAQGTFSETFSSFGRAQYSKLAGTKIGTIDDLAAAIKSGQVKPSQLAIETGKINGKGYIMNTRTATALERANVPRSQWNIVDKTRDKYAMDRLRAQLERNNITPGQAISTPKSESAGASAGSANASNGNSGGGLLGAIGRATGLW